jgi:hypothetical protein
MPSIDDQLTEIYVFIDDHLKQRTVLAQWRASNNIDSKPIPLCHQLRHGCVRLLREDGAHFGKTQKGWFFGFKLHALRHVSGRVVLRQNLVTTNIVDCLQPSATLYRYEGITILAVLLFQSNTQRSMQFGT